MRNLHSEMEQRSAAKARADAHEGVFDPPLSTVPDRSYATIYKEHCVRRAYLEAHAEAVEELEREGHPYTGPRAELEEVE
jgi:hypothetical protein